jgi:serine/threonine protein phosphatase 1
MATVVIGDIHGNRRALDDLLSKVQAELQAEDTVVFLGDYIDRGPDARGCVDRILEFRATVSATVVTLLGNHEDWLLRSLADPTRHSWVLGMEAFDTIASYSRQAAAELRSALEAAGPRLLTERVALPYDLFFRALPKSHLDFFQTLQPYLRSPDALCVHGGLDPRILDLARQPRDAFLWGTDDFVQNYRGPDLVVYGHWGDALINPDGWPVPRIRTNTIGIDSIAHGVLTAIRLPGRNVLQSARYAGGT